MYLFGKKSIVSGIVATALGLTLFVSPANAQLNDPVLESGWKLSQKNKLFNHCMTLFYSTKEHTTAFPKREHKSNVCDCFAKEYMPLFTYQEFITIGRIEFRRIGKEQGKYDKDIYQSTSESSLWKNWEVKSQILSDTCATKEVAMRGIEFVEGEVTEVE